MSKSSSMATALSVRDFVDAPLRMPDEEIGPVVIISDALPERNGVGAYYKDLLDQLNGLGLEATFLCPNPDRWQLLKFPLPGDATQTVFLPSLFRFHRVMKATRPRAIVVGTPGPFGLLGTFWAQYLNARLIVGFHTHFSSVTDLYSNRWLRGFSRFYFSIADNLQFRYGDQILANSDQMVELAKSLGARNVEVMGTLLPPSALEEPVPVRDEVRHVLFAGRLAPEKRVQLVVDAARELPEVQFTIAGDGPLKDDIFHQAQTLPNLRTLGWVGRREILEAMDDADILVLPSTVESFGTVALEAMSRQRLPLVSKNCGIVDWPNLVDHIFTLGDDESVADAITRIRAIDSGTRKAMASAARQAALALNHNSILHWANMLVTPDEEPTGVT